MSALSQSAPRVPRALLAKLIIGISAIVALATSAPPPWTTTEGQELRVVLDDRSEQRVLLSIEITGPLYQGAYGGLVDVTAVADRAASDFSLEARLLTPDTLAVDSFSALQPDSGAEPDGGADTLTAQPSLESPDRASLQLGLPCIQLEERPESCLARAELRLARESARPLTAQLSVITRLMGGDGSDPPPGSVTIDLQELAP